VKGQGANDVSSSAPARHRSRRRSLFAASAAPSGVRSEINVTPLVDVVLVLLIIFMVVTPLLHRGVPLDLPATRHHARRPDTGAQLVVSVRADGVYLDSTPIPDDRMADTFLRELAGRRRPVHVRGDRSLRYGQVRVVLDLLHEAGADTLNLASQETR